ncbi:MAG TPA: hypothetical protein DCM86_06190 [Verrucomicrobiales bacterium]|nr:hypothetical protein [Verrucomicrobiales bacterium]
MKPHASPFRRPGPRSAAPALALVSLLLTLGRPAVAATPSAAGQWPQFRGPNSSGVLEAAKPPSFFGPGTNLGWKAESPAGVSSPCIWGNRLFLTGEAEGELVTLCYDTETGRVLWRKGVQSQPPRELHKANHPASATPATDGSALCVYFPTFGLVAYDYSGRELWRKPMPGLLVRNGSGTSPAMIEGRLILNCDVEEGKSFIAAYEPRSGREQWRTPRTNYISGYTTPVLWSHEGRDELLISGSLRVAGYALRDGREVWSAAGTEAVSVTPTPVLGHGMAYVMSRSIGGAKLPPFPIFLLGVDKDGDGKISRAEMPRQMVEQGMFAGFDQNHDGFVEQAEWDRAVAFVGQGDYGLFALRPPGEGDLTATHIAWRHKKGVASVSSPLFYRDRLYVVQDGGRVSCYEGASGEKRIEQERLGPEGEYFASPVAADGRIFYSSARGVITVTEAGDTLKVIASNDLAEPILATPALHGNALVVRTQNHLWSFHAAAK